MRSGSPGEDFSLRHSKTHQVDQEKAPIWPLTVIIPSPMVAWPRSFYLPNANVSLERLGNYKAWMKWLADSFFRQLYAPSTESAVKSFFGGHAVLDSRGCGQGKVMFILLVSQKSIRTSHYYSPEKSSESFKRKDRSFNRPYHFQRLALFLRWDSESLVCWLASRDVTFDFDV